MGNGVLIIQTTENIYAEARAILHAVVTQGLPVCTFLIPCCWLGLSASLLRFLTIAAGYM
eukprot:6201097-Pleurochrysis_carterae.AAC.2